MTGASGRTVNDTAPEHGAVFDAINDTLSLAAGYVEIAGRAVELRDAKVLTYAVRCTSSAIVAAAEMSELPSNQGRARS